MRLAHEQPTEYEFVSRFGTFEKKGLETQNIYLHFSLYFDIHTTLTLLVVLIVESHNNVSGLFRQISSVNYVWSTTT